MGKEELTKHSYIYCVSRIKLRPTNILLKTMKFIYQLFSDFSSWNILDFCKKNVTL